LSLKDYIDKFKKKYIETKVSYAHKPDFKPSSIVRKHIIFSGKVQNVGFRYETYQLANSIGLKGWVKNKVDGTVESEIQGENDKIAFLISHMKSLKRGRVTDVKIKEIDLIDNDNSFEIIR